MESSKENPEKAPMDHLDWNKAKTHFDTVKQEYLDLDGTTGVNVQFALKIVFEPLARRYNSGERTPELHEDMMGVK